MSVAEYFPMAVGRSWRYRFRFGAQDAGELRQEAVGNRESARSSVWRMMRYMTGSEPEPFPVIITDEVVRISGAEVLRTPVEPGTRWYDSDEEGIRDYEIVRVGFTLDVPAGRYDDCVEVVAYRRGAEVQRTVFAKGVGMVHHRAFVPGGDMELALTEMTDRVLH